MTPNPATMTVQECIAFAMNAKGWRAIVGQGASKWERGSTSDGTYEIIWTHPFQPTLDSAASAMPSGWRLHAMVWSNADQSYTLMARKMRGDVLLGRVQIDAYTDDGFMGEPLKDELLARWRLVVACMLAEKESP